MTTDRIAIYAAALGLAFGVGYWAGSVRERSRRLAGLTAAEYIVAEVQEHDRAIRAELRRCREDRP